MDPDRERSIPRRQFVRSAVAIGGASALAACQERERAPLGGGDPATATDERTGATATNERGGPATDSPTRRGTPRRSRRGNTSGATT